jgi:hypothetical protein
VLLTNARSRLYHTPGDVPRELAWDKMSATARWLEHFVRASCARHEAPFQFVRRRDDVSSLDSFLDLTSSLLDASPEAAMGHAMAERLRGLCRSDGSLPEAHQGEIAMLVAALEAGLA